MLVSDVIAQVRSSLGDASQHRWTDDRLVYLANQGQKQICIIAGLLRRNGVIPLALDKLTYRLPPDCVVLRRVEYKGHVIPIIARDDTDNPEFVLTSDIAVVKTNLPMGHIDIFPEVPTFEQSVTFVQGAVTDTTFSFIPEYGVVTNADLPFNLLDLYGTVTDLTYNKVDLEPSTKYGDVMDSNVSQDMYFSYPMGKYGVAVSAEFTQNIQSHLGFVSNVKDSLYKVSGTYGLVTDIASEDAILKIYYEAVPSVKLTYTSEFVIPDVWEDAMHKYIVGSALQDDNDANNIARGEAMLAKFVAMVSKAREATSKDFSAGASKKYTTTFRRI